MNPTDAPPILSLSRIAMLAASMLVALSSGTNYVYSAYAPQLGARLHITHTQLNIIGLAGNVGGHSTGPIWGSIVDSYGPKSLFVVAFLFHLVGYSGIWRIFSAGLPLHETTLGVGHFYILVLCGFLTGAGGNAGLASAINSTAKTFPDRTRGTTTGLVLSGFGLSAFFFSAIAHLFSGDTASFLLMLALGTSFPMIVGFVFVRPISLPTSEVTSSLNPAAIDEETAPAEASVLAVLREDHSHTALLADTEDEDTADAGAIPPAVTLPQTWGESRFDVELSPNDSARMSHSFSETLTGRTSKGYLESDGQLDLYRMAMWRSADFWILFSTLSLMSGTGLMYINNVGSMSQALLAKADMDYDETAASRWQVAQVSAISIGNCLGRILVGLAADVVKSRLHCPRSYCILLVSSLFIISQMSCLAIDDVRDLWKASAVLGLAYGGMVGLYPTMTMEYFGLPHLSENWGFMNLSPLLGGNLFSIAFGHNFDAHTPSQGIVTPRAPTSSLRQCMEGRDCYASSLYMTSIACACAFVLGALAGWRDRRRMQVSTEPY